MSMISLDINELDGLSQDCTVHIKKIGQEYCSPQKCMERRTKKYDYSSLHFVLFGSGTLKTAGKTYKLTRGHAFLLFQGEEYEYYPNPKDPWSYMWVDIQGENLESLFKYLGFTKDEPIVKINNLQEIIHILKEFQESYSQSIDGEIVSYGYFLLIFEKLKLNRESRHLGYTKVFNQKRVRDILIYMNNNYRNNISPKEVSYKFGISYGTLVSLFKSTIDMTPLEYFSGFRISKACEMLQEDSKLPIGDIATIVGYPDARYFSRLFKKVKGVTPSEYIETMPDDDPYEWLKRKKIDYR